MTQSTTAINKTSDDAPRFRARLIFANAVLLYARSEGTTNLSAYLELSEAFTGAAGHLKTYKAFRDFISRNRDRLRRDDALTDEISALLTTSALNRRDVVRVPTVTVHANRRTYAKELKARDHADAAQSAAAIVGAIERDKSGRTLRTIIRHYAELLAQPTPRDDKQRMVQ